MIKSPVERPGFLFCVESLASNSSVAPREGGVHNRRPLLSSRLGRPAWRATNGCGYGFRVSLRSPGTTAELADRDPGFDAEPVIGPRIRADPLASPRDDI